MNPERPFAAGRRSAVLVLNELRADGGRLTRAWLARLRALDSAGWSTHAALVNRDPELASTVATLVGAGLMPAATVVHHHPLRDRRLRPGWAVPLAPGESLDPRIGDWLDWLTAQVPGAVVMADSPAAYPYLAAMTNPTVARVAVVHLNHLSDPADDPVTGALAGRFGPRLADCNEAFDALVTMTHAQAEDLRARFGPDTPVRVIPPMIEGASPVPGGPVPPRASRGGLRRLVSVGPLEPDSRHEHVLRAAAGVLHSHDDVLLDLIGEGALADALRARAEELGVGGRVRVIPPDSHDAFAGATLGLWTGRRDSYPLAIRAALRDEVPVLAYDVRYGPAELLTSPALGELVPNGDVDALGGALARWLAHPVDHAAVAEAAGVLRSATDPAAVGTAWADLCAELAEGACDHRRPTLLVESMATTSQVLRLPGVLADDSGDLSAWTCTDEALELPAGQLVPPVRPDEDDAPEVVTHAAGTTRDVVVRLRSSGLAHAAIVADRALPVEFESGTSRIPLLSLGFEPRLIAARSGTALLQRADDGALWVHPHRGLVEATLSDGRLLARLTPDGPPSDVTHAISWTVDVDWDRLHATAAGATFTGTLHAARIVPAEGSTPDVCVPDVGGYSRAIGHLRWTAQPTVADLDWSVPVEGLLEVDPLVATTALARGALSLHVGYRGLLVPVGGLWARGRRATVPLTCARGGVTLLPSPRGRVLAAPGRGYRARVSGAVRTAIRRG